MSGKAAMRSCFLVEQLFLCRRNHLQGATFALGLWV